MPVPVHRTTSPRPKPDERDLGFGRVFTDHVFRMEHDPDHGWHGDRVEPYAALSLEPAAAVFHYGQALFEGLKAYRTERGDVQLFRARDHCLRMSGGGARLAMPAVDPERLLAGLVALVDTERDWVPSAPGTSLYLRPLLVATEAFLGVRPARRYSLVVMASPVGPYYARGLQPVRIRVEEKWARAVRGGTASVKTSGNYAASLIGAQEARAAGFDEALWIDHAAGTLQEVGMMNVVLRFGDVLATPPLDGTILPGITRRCILELARDLGIEASERTVSLTEVVEGWRTGELKEVFGCGTAAVVAPIGELGYRGERMRVGDGGVGEMAQAFHRAITDVQYGRVPDVARWTVPVPRR